MFDPWLRQIGIGARIAANRPPARPGDEDESLRRSWALCDLAIATVIAVVLLAVIVSAALAAPAPNSPPGSWRNTALDAIAVVALATIVLLGPLRRHRLEAVRERERRRAARPPRPGLVAVAEHEDDEQSPDPPEGCASSADEN